MAPVGPTSLDSQTVPRIPNFSFVAICFLSGKGQPVSILLLKELNSQQDKSFINCNSFFNIYCIQSEVVRVLAKPNQTRCHHLNNNHLLHNDKNIRPSAIPLAFGCKKAIKVKEIISSRICRERFTPTKQKN
jgi:hypothetical protein